MHIFTYHTIIVLMFVYYWCLFCSNYFTRLVTTLNVYNIVHGAMHFHEKARYTFNTPIKY